MATMPETSHAWIARRRRLAIPGSSFPWKLSRAGPAVAQGRQAAPVVRAAGRLRLLVRAAGRWCIQAAGARRRAGPVISTERTRPARKPARRRVADPAPCGGPRDDAWQKARPRPEGLPARTS